MGDFGGIKAGEAYVSLGARPDAAQIRAAGHQFAGVLRTALGGLGLPQILGLGGGIASMVALIKSATSESLDIWRSAQRMHMATDDFERLKVLSERTGLPIERTAMAIHRMSRAIGEAVLSGKGGVFQLLGLDPKSLSRLSPQDALEQVARAIMNVGDSYRRAAIEAQLFGRSGMELEEVLRRIASGELKGIEVATPEERRKGAALEQTLGSTWRRLKLGIVAPGAASGLTGGKDLGNPVAEVGLALLSPLLQLIRFPVEYAKTEVAMEVAERKAETHRRIAAMQAAMSAAKDAPLTAYADAAVYGSREAVNTILGATLEPILQGIEANTGRAADALEGEGAEVN
jgi:hypothetical protein